MFHNDKQGRDRGGRFGRGNQFAKGVNTGKRTGRPPRRYSIATALAHFADQAETIDNDGTPRTKAWLAAEWLWAVVTTGEDRGEPVSFRDRVEALKTIQSATEPVVKWDPQDDEAAKPTPEEVGMEDVAAMTDEELVQLQALLQKAADASGANV